MNHHGGKVFTDVLGPLYRYLLKQVGRKWDAVYSEVAESLPKTSVQNIHVYTHLWQFVEKTSGSLTESPSTTEVTGMAHRSRAMDAMPSCSFTRATACSARQKRGKVLIGFVTWPGPSPMRRASRCIRTSSTTRWTECGSR